ncbi:MAG: hypothetical protein ACOYKZ_00075 [Chlamydiia bacterium]
MGKPLGNVASKNPQVPFEPGGGKQPRIQERPADETNKPIFDFSSMDLGGPFGWDKLEPVHLPWVFTMLFECNVRHGKSYETKSLTLRRDLGCPVMLTGDWPLWNSTTVPTACFL